MANVPLKSIKFPGLSDTYQVPQIDNTLAVAGKAAESAVTGGMLSNLDNRVNTLHQLVNYKYDTPLDGNIHGGGATAYSVDVTRFGTLIKLNGTMGAASSALRLILSNVSELKYGSSTTTPDTDGITLTNGHTYRLRLHVISGSETGSTSPAWVLSTSATRTGVLKTDSNGDAYTDLAYDSSTYTNGVRIVLFLERNSGNTYSNWTVQLTLEDLTVSRMAALEGRVDVIEAKLDYLELTDQIDLSEMGD